MPRADSCCSLQHEKSCRWCAWLFFFVYLRFQTIDCATAHYCCRHLSIKSKKPQLLPTLTFNKRRRNARLKKVRDCLHMPSIHVTVRACWTDMPTMLTRPTEMTYDVIYFTFTCVDDQLMCTWYTLRCNYGPLSTLILVHGNYSATNYSNNLSY